MAVSEQQQLAIEVKVSAHKKKKKTLMGISHSSKAYKNTDFRMSFVYAVPSHCCCYILFSGI